MELRQLEYFIAVASEMNFSRAAHRVRVVQSALSTSVGKLEKELGVELFDRSRQQITITPAGELFREHARRVIHAARLAKDAMGDYRGQLSGIVEFGSLISFSTLDVPEILGQFHRDYPARPDQTAEQPGWTGGAPNRDRRRFTRPGTGVSAGSLPRQHGDAVAGQRADAPRLSARPSPRPAGPNRHR